VRAILATIADLRKRGEEVLAKREEVAKTQGRVSLRISAWKQTANNARRGVENALDAYAIQHKLPRDYSDDFFPAARVSKKRKTNAQPAGEETPG
jgi:hypothetical protein